jgi:DNA-binding CsgD family transcriptional regulator
MRPEGVQTVRAEALTRVQALSCCGEGEAVDLLARVGEQVRRAVPCDRLGWQIYDPDAMVPVAAGSTEAVTFDERLAFCELEQRGGDVNLFRSLARARLPVASLDAATNGAPQTSRRFRELLAPVGFRHELRAALVHQGMCWGTLTLLRGTGPGFSSTEIRWLLSSSKAVAAGLKHRLAGATGTQSAPDPGVVILSPGRAPLALTPSAQRWLELLAQPPWSKERLDVALMSVAVRARALGPSEPLRVHLPSPAGWAAVHASMASSSQDVTAVVDSARPEQILPLLAGAYGLTASEQAVVGLVLQGLPSKAIARRLWITTDTVGDHLKAIFRKTDTHGRGELCHRFALDAWGGAAGADARGAT